MKVIDTTLGSTFPRLELRTSFGPVSVELLAREDVHQPLEIPARTWSSPSLLARFRNPPEICLHSYNLIPRMEHFNLHLGHRFC